MMDRREFLLGLAAVAGAAACSRRDAQPTPPGDTMGADFARGHRLRGPDFPPPSEHRKLSVAIVGGGVSGLSAAWKLAKAGVVDFRLFEPENRVTGGF